MAGITLNYTADEINKSLSQISANTSDISSLKTSVQVDIPNNIESIRRLSSGYDSRISAAEASVGETQTLIGSLQSSVSAQQKTLIDIKDQKIPSLESQVSTKVEQSTYNSKISSLEDADKVNTQNLINTIDSNYKEMLSRFSTDEGNIEKNSSNITTLTNRLESLNTNLGNAPQILENIQSSMASLDQQVIDLQAKVETNTAKIEEHDTRISSLEDAGYITSETLKDYASMSYLESIVNQLNQIIDSQNTAINSQNDVITQLAARIDALEQQNKGES